jgi:hypothetical protein
MASNFYLKTQKSVGNTWTLLNNYTVSSSVLSTVVLGIAIANTTGATIQANVGIFTGNYAAGASANIYLVYNAPISAGGTLIPVGVDQKVVLQSNNAIFVQTSALNSADAVMSVLELS